jgi:octaprenyl-diphosphate synthase
MDLGIAFQLADDLLDFTSDEHAMGKAAGADLLEGKITLPLIMLQEQNPEVREELERVMYDGVYDEGRRESITAKLAENGTLESIRDIANSFAESARKNLVILPQTRYRSALEEIPNFVINRNS